LPDAEIHSGSLGMEKIKVFIATGNAGKLRELKELFTETYGPEFELLGRAPKDCEETGSTFLENAKIKADALLSELRTEARTGLASRYWVLADDSGLCVNALKGAPGLHSARYAGDHVASDLHMKKLLSELKKAGSPKPWSAHYHCALYLYEIANSQVLKSTYGEGQCFGEIVEEAKGSSGFGYDPIFLFPQIGLRFSELDDREKNRLSHRKAAFRDLQKKS
jgi:XTP/dITP diphosphohydrolase